MAQSLTFTNLIRQIRNAIYGKDVRESIASALELTYDASSGDVAQEAAERADAAATHANEVSQTVESKLLDIDSGLANLDNIVKVSDTQPTEPQNKIWIQSQDSTEYKIPSFAAYETLWSRFETISSTYEQGNGGIKSIQENTSYSNPQDPLEREYVITYSNDVTSTLHIRNGERGETGATDYITNTAVWYCAVRRDLFTPVPPVDGWVNSMPSVNSGDYLWIRTVIDYNSGAQAYIYALSRMGVDGNGAVDSVAIGENGEAMTQAVRLPVDNTPTVNSGSLMTSGGIYLALQNLLNNTALTGTPTAPTTVSTTRTTQLATTEFVHNAWDQKAKRISISMNVSPYTYADSAITENTYCIFNGTIDTSLAWATTGGSLTITTDNLPAGGLSFDVILITPSTAT